MSPSELLRSFIRESLGLGDLDQSIVRRDDDGHPIIRKMVTFEKPGSRYRVGDNVDTDINSQGDVVVDDAEVWVPQPPEAEVTPPKRRTVHRVA